MTRARARIRTTTRLPAFALLGLSLLLAACDEVPDVDLRGAIGGSVDTSEAAARATGDRPDPDNRGIISYPTYQVAVARRNDTVADVADRIGLPPQELASYNGLQTGDVLRRGEIVALPRRVAEPSPETGSPITGPIRPAGEVDVATLASNAIERAGDTSRAAPAVTGAEPTRHRVKRGETAFTIARLYQVSPRSLAEWNGLDRDFAVREGQFLLIPVTAANAATTSATTSETVPEPGDGSPTPTPPSSAQPLPEDEPERTAVLAPAVPAAPAVTATPVAPPAPAEPVADIGQDEATSPSAGAKMVMPVSGSIIREYAKGRNEGIDIAASAGQPVKAAASGSVASISTTTEGVRLLLIRHPGDLITVYTHIDDINVAKGDAVSRGQTVARVAAGSPSFLHFEVRKGFDSTDPMDFLQ